MDRYFRGKSSDFFGNDMEFNVADALRWIAFALERVGDKMDRANELKEVELKKNGVQSPILSKTPLLQNYRPPERPATGCVYVLKCMGYYKIGMTSDIKTRKPSLDLCLPEPAELVLTIPCENYIQFEKHLHDRFASKRKNGEWFDLDDEDIKRLAQDVQP